jgi:ATP-dependent helicase HrpB
MDLPIFEIIPALRSALQKSSRAVLTAPPGSGKTTIVPLELLSGDWLAGKKILVLEPRRLAARAAAKRMSDLLNEKVGETIGYRVRMENKVSSKTRAEVVTEGILTAMLQSDPALEGVGCVIFDEFHERSVHADLGLALALESQEALRDDLRILVMSATISSAEISAFLGGCPALSCGGKMFDVETHYAGVSAKTYQDTEGRMQEAVMRALETEKGGILVFLPGEAEIRRLEAELKKRAAGLPVSIIPLYGSMPLSEQDAALGPAPSGVRKIVLATSVAETSLTVSGVRIVVDCGFSRVAVYDPADGFESLRTVRVTKAAADQRRGRAGRTETGVCVRMWSEASHASLEDFSPPEILRADPAPLRMALAAWGASSDADCLKLKWLTPPPLSALSGAAELLRNLGALGPDGRLTGAGEKMARLPLHPRFAAMIVKSAGARKTLACALAALLEERDFLRGGGADIRHRVEMMLSPAAPPPPGAKADTARLRRAREHAAELARLSGAAPLSPQCDSHDAGAVLALAFPDRIGRNRKSGGGRSGTFALSGGGGAFFHQPDPLEKEDYITAASLGDFGAESKIFLAAPVAEVELEEIFGSLVKVSDEAVWDGRTSSARAVRRKTLGSLVMREDQTGSPDPAKAAEILLSVIRKEGISILPWSPGALSLRARVNFLRAIDSSNWPDFSDAALLASLEDWLAPALHGVTSLAGLRGVSLERALEGLLGYGKISELNRLAPTHMRAPTGTGVRLDYGDGAPPVMAVRIQEMFGTDTTPSVAGGKVPVTLHLLSPSMRPAQITRDLKGFWQSSYFLVKKDLRGRYPKHYWPDNPLEAEPRKKGKPSPAE